MKVLQINSVCGVGSTGRIAADLHACLTVQGEQSIIAYGRGEACGCADAIRIGNTIDLYLHAAKARLLDRTGFGSEKVTRRFLEQVKAFDPDIIHLHNIHGYYLHVGELFDYLKGADKPVIWTLHDCWPFTGHCAYFEYVGCSRWAEAGGCHDCPQRTNYPARLWRDASALNFADKRRLFTGVKNMTLVTPSKWLAELAERSFLAGYPVRVIPNGVDVQEFSPAESDFREKYGIGGDEFVVLGVASIWEERKGLSFLLELIGRLGRGFRLVVVGVTEKQREALPEGAVGIIRTTSVGELAAIYSAADVFVNPTLEDNFPTTNLEALACGTPVITFRTGGSVESVNDATGLIVDKGDAAGLESAVRAVRQRGKLSYTSACLMQARAKYDKQITSAAYTALYRELLHKGDAE